jgi:hypothetical protein
MSNESVVLIELINRKKAYRLAKRITFTSVVFLGVISNYVNLAQYIAIPDQIIILTAISFMLFYTVIYYQRNLRNSKLDWNSELFSDPIE